MEQRPVEGKPGVSILAFNGEFVTDEIPEVSDRIQELIDAGQYRFVVNMNRLDFIESSPLGFLIKTQKRLKTQNGELVLSQPSEFIRTAINTLGLDHVFEVFPEDGAALEYFGGR